MLPYIHENIWIAHNFQRRCWGWSSSVPIQHPACNCNWLGCMAVEIRMRMPHARWLGGWVPVCGAWNESTHGSYVGQSIEKYLRWRCERRNRCGLGLSMVTGLWPYSRVTSARRVVEQPQDDAIDEKRYNKRQVCWF